MDDDDDDVDSSCPADCMGTVVSFFIKIPLVLGINKAQASKK